MEIKGRVIEIFATNQISEKFRKREFVVEYAENPQYPEYLKLEMIQDNCDHLDGYKVGDMVEVDINIKGRKYESPEKGTMYFNTLQAWRIRPSGDNDNPDYMGIPSDESNSQLPF